VQIGDVAIILLPAFTAKTGATRTITPWPIRLRPCLVNVQRPAIKIRAVDGGNGLFAFAIVPHLYEAKTTRLPGFPIRHDVHTINSTVGFEQCTHRFFRRPKTEVSNVNIFQVYFSFSDLKAANLEGGRR